MDILSCLGEPGHLDACVVALCLEEGGGPLGFDDAIRRDVDARG